MSRVGLQGNTLVQTFRDQTRTLGFVEQDEGTDTVSVFLRFPGEAEYLVAHQFASMDEARDQADSLPVVGVADILWQREATRNRVIEVLEEKADEIAQQVPGIAKHLMSPILSGVASEMTREAINEFSFSSECVAVWIVRILINLSSLAG